MIHFLKDDKIYAYTEIDVANGYGADMVQLTEEEFTSWQDAKELEDEANAPAPLTNLEKLELTTGLTVAEIKTVLGI